MTLIAPQTLFAVCKVWRTCGLLPGALRSLRFRPSSQWASHGGWCLHQGSSRRCGRHARNLLATWLGLRSRAAAFSSAAVELTDGCAYTLIVAPPFTVRLRTT